MPDIAIGANRRCPVVGSFLLHYDPNVLKAWWKRCAAAPTVTDRIHHVESEASARLDYIELQLEQLADVSIPWSPYIRLRDEDVERVGERTLILYGLRHMSRRARFRWAMAFGFALVLLTWLGYRVG